MLENVLNWILDIRASDETLDLDFVETDLVDIPITNAEQIESTLFDAMVSQATDNANTPIGKQVF